MVLVTAVELRETYVLIAVSSLSSSSRFLIMTEIGFIMELIIYRCQIQQGLLFV